jgi:hypothetical protein
MREDSTVVEIHSHFLEFIGTYRHKTGKIKIRGDHLKSENKLTVLSSKVLPPRDEIRVE